MFRILIVRGAFTSRSPGPFAGKQEECEMRKQAFALALFIGATAAAPAMAERPVEPWELDGFIGQTLKGRGHAPLGIVGAADTRSGVISMVGPQGQIATIHTSMLVSTGSANLRAPELSIGDVVAASNLGYSGVPIVAPSIIVGPPEAAPSYYDEYGRPLYDDYGNRLYYD